VENNIDERQIDRLREKQMYRHPSTHDKVLNVYAVMYVKRENKLIRRGGVGESGMQEKEKKERER
jgi:hypothetical protein